MLSLLRERGYVSADTRSVSSTVANIYVEEIEKELAAKLVVAPAPAAAPEAAVVETAKSTAPTGAFVKSAQDVVREKEAARAAVAPKPAAPAAQDNKPAPQPERA